MVRAVAIGLSALLVGLGTAYYWTASYYRGMLNDPEVLSSRLDKLESQRKGVKKPAASPAAPVRVAAVAWKEIAPEKRIIGRLVEVRKATVASEVTGKIVQMDIEEGTPVIAGRSLLAKVDTTWTELAIARHEAKKTAIQADLKFAGSQIKRLKKLVKDNVVTDTEYEQQEALVARLLANLAETSHLLAEERERLARSAIFAPFDGTVVSKCVELGGRVSPGSPIAEIVSRGRIDAKINVPEDALELISEGDELPVVIEPLKTEVEGKVVAVNPCGATASRTFRVRVAIDDGNGRFRPGMSVSVPVPVAHPFQALVVHRDGVLKRPDGATVWVVVREGGEARVLPVPVAVSAQAGDELAVEPQRESDKALLLKGSQVVIEGAERLRPNQLVRITRLEDQLAGGTPKQ